MTTQTIFCLKCKKNYTVRKEDLLLMKRYDLSFDSDNYSQGCFFKNLVAIKKSIKQKEFISQQYSTSQPYDYQT